MFVSFDRAILHADADAFFASVEQRDDPKLRGRPVIVGGGVVMAASYEARARGVRGAMGGARARRLCPEAVIVPPRFEAYTAASRDLFRLFRSLAPVVEGLSLEEAFLDVTGLERISGTPAQIGGTLRRRAAREVGLSVSVGVADTKIAAKMASRAAKPDGILVVTPERALEFLHRIPVEDLWGVGAPTARRLHARGLMTVGHLARASEARLAEILGEHAGHRLHALANNRDPRRVRRGSHRRSFGSQSAFRRTASPARLDRTLFAIAERVTRRMRAAGRAGRTVILRVRFGDYSRASRSRTLDQPTAATRPVLAAARSLLAEAMPRIESREATLLGIAVTNLTAEGGQLHLPERPDYERLDWALDELRERFGPGAVTRAARLRGERG
ncbi:MAG TPA: DNA polymerase IV [Solirubrobacterales bacterium]|nr:DNA polymerase IV [Solirubrobacterales bacterium]